MGTFPLVIPKVLALLLALGSPEWRVRDEASKVLEAATTFNHPVLVVGQKVTDQEISTRCRDINERHIQGILHRVSTYPNYPDECWPDFDQLGWDEDTNTFRFTDWMVRALNVNHMDKQLTTRAYVIYLLHRGVPESSVRALVDHLWAQQDRHMKTQCSSGCGLIGPLLPGVFIPGPLPMPPPVMVAPPPRPCEVKR